MRLHVLSLVHTQTTRRFLTCAYTQKVLKFCDMMSDDAEIILYSGDENEAACSEQVELYTENERVGWFGEWDANGLHGQASELPSDECWRTFNSRAIPEIAERIRPGDFILATWGRPQAPVMEAFQQIAIPVEWAVGYKGVLPGFRIFESYAWMHYVYGVSQQDGKHFDAVIPNFFDRDDFKPGLKSDFLLYMGRVIPKKGVQTAIDIANRMDRDIVVAGPGDTNWLKGDFEAVGPLDVNARAAFLSEAQALICPTEYVEPFGGVAVEAMLSGTPVISTDFGAFTEIVTPPVGRRIRTLAEGVAAVEEVTQLAPRAIRRHALARWSLEAVRPRFLEHFERLATLWDKGWYQ